MKCLPTLALFLLQLAYPTLSYVASGQKTHQNRFSPFRSMRLSATNDEQNANDAVADTANLFERTVRKVTRNKTYKFGDLARSAASASTKTFEGAVRTVTQDEDYHFGDYSKKVLSTGTGTFESAVKSVTGNEQYQFGVSTHSVLARAYEFSYMSLFICTSRI